MKTYIIHVSTDTVREKHILGQIEGKGLAHEFVLDGDKSSITPAICEQYFTGKMLKDSFAAARSCTYKHILTYQQMAQRPEQVVLVIEDDMIFYPHFNERLQAILEEVKRDGLSNFLISLEDSNLKYVKGSLRQKGKMLYPQKRGRMTGIYLIDKEAAASILRYIDKNKASEVIDWMHNLCSEAGVINIYWSQPPLGIQGSLNGQMLSLLDRKAPGIIRDYTFRMKRAYKQLLYWLR